MDAALLALLAQGAALGLSAGASPGPLQTLLVSESLLGGVRRSWPIALAPLITDAPIILLMLIVLRALPSGVVRLLGLAGGAYVLYLAWGLWQQWRAGAGRDFQVADAAIRPWITLRKGALTNFLNPNPYLYWGLVGGPILLGALERSAAHAAAFLLGMYGVFISLLIALAGIFDQARRLGPRVVRGLLLISLGVLIVLGVLLIGRGLGG